MKAWKPDMPESRTTLPVANHAAVPAYLTEEQLAECAGDARLRGRDWLPQAREEVCGDAAAIQRHRGKIENCQIGVFPSHASQQGHAFLDRELYLPQEWAKVGEQRREAGMPEETTFKTKGQLAREESPLCLGSWDGGDRRLHFWLEEQKVPHVLAVKSTEPLWVNTELGPD
jgi:hypothetical protein